MNGICDLFQPLSGFLTLFGSKHPPTSVVETETDASLSTPHTAKTIQWRDSGFPSEKMKKNLPDRSKGIVEPLPSFTLPNTSIGNLSSFGGFKGLHNGLVKMKKERKKPCRISFSKQGEVLISSVRRIKYGRILSIGHKHSNEKYFQKIIRNNLQKKKMQGSACLTCERRTSSPAPLPAPAPLACSPPPATPMLSFMALLVTLLS